ncbi:MAG: hypothetical protein EZS28_008827 [Streblomastix strix]|uniref:Uncharacterized protein n=1 Tax=Streblomastix strix TaxID=222440 RepID=A0A5J4WLE6_9EUKA|nr:MAG: hypothetical protein EZS28_008827 [Streblomastix strix]
MNNELKREIQDERQAHEAYIKQIKTVAAHEQKLRDEAIVELKRTVADLKQSAQIWMEGTIRGQEELCNTRLSLALHSVQAVQANERERERMNTSQLMNSNTLNSNAMNANAMNTMNSINEQLMDNQGIDSYRKNGELIHLQSIGISPIDSPDILLQPSNMNINDRKNKQLRQQDQQDANEGIQLGYQSVFGDGEIINNNEEDDEEEEDEDDDNNIQSNKLKGVKSTTTTRRQGRWIKKDKYKHNQKESQWIESSQVLYTSRDRVYTPNTKRSNNNINNTDKSERNHSHRKGDNNERIMKDVRIKKKNIHEDTNDRTRMNDKSSQTPKRSGSLRRRDGND